MHCSENSLCKYQVDQVDDQNSSIVEDLCCDGDLDVSLPGSPNDSHDAGDNSCHAESEENRTKQELVVPFAIFLEDYHIGSGKAKVENQEDRRDWNINIYRRHTAGTCGSRRVGGLLTLKSAHLISSRDDIHSRLAASLACFGRPLLYRLCRSAVERVFVARMHVENWTTYLSYGARASRMCLRLPSQGGTIESGVSDEANM